MDESKALASMICGIVSLVFCGLVVGIVAIVLATMYENETGDTNNSKAKAGKICGIVALSINLAVIALYIFIIALSFGAISR